MNDQKETILVTGSSGLLGYAVAKRLAESFTVVGFDTKAPAHPPSNAECLYVDLTSDASVQRGLQAVRQLHGERLASVLHFAAYYDFSGEASPKYDEVTVRGTERLLRMLQGFQVEQFVFSSTMLVHAPSPVGKSINEDSSLEPKWVYPQSKVNTEQVIRAERGNIPTVIFRLAGVYDDLCDSIPLAHQMQRIYEHQPTAYVFPGDISRGQAFVHLDDVVEVYARVVARRAQLPPELTLLIGEAETLSYDELQRTYAHFLHDEELKTREIAKKLAKAVAAVQAALPFGEKPFIKPFMIDRADDHYALDISRARAILDWNPRRSLREALAPMVMALKADPVTWYRQNKLEPPLWLSETAHIAASEKRTRTLETPMNRSQTAMSEHAMHDSMSMGNQTPHEAMPMGREPMHGTMPAMSEPQDGKRAKEMELLEMRAQQAQLEHQREREARNQKTQDREMQELMQRDPKLHVERMRAQQERYDVLREETRTLLGREGETYQELIRTQQRPREEMTEPGILMARMQEMVRWTQIPLMILGAWLIASPSALGYRSAALTWSDVISGALVVLFSVLGLDARRHWALWANTAIGLWLLFAPLAFWAPDAAAYANDTLIGALVIAFAILILMMMPMPGPAIPYEWSYNPSTWLQRAPIIALGLLSFFMARYMAAFQLGHIPTAWDPLFGDGTLRVLTSNVSKAWPVSDAGLGALTYMIEVLAGIMGDTRRWRTMPWMVAMFGFVVIPLGITSVVLVILQPLAVGAWCTLCLISALFMLVMIALSVDEVLAMFQFLGQSRRAGKSLWRTFWLGGNALDGPVEINLSRPGSSHVRDMFWGVTLPWPLLLSAALGAWLMFAPSVFQTQGLAAQSDNLLGALVVTTALIALAEVARPLRLVNLLLGASIIVAPWLLGATTLALWNDVMVGALVMLLSLPRGKIRNRYGRWDRYLL